ncbi:MAG: hypothetical protein ORN49_02150, partial [Rhodobacteraceae bacterium]|nr:hypothetical protein [Paracoccaceae bacterium]
RAPDAFVTEMTDEIASYGDASGLGPDGIERMIASDRARARARAAERIMQADLDNDGTVVRAELDNLIAISPEGTRGRLETAWRLADADGNGAVSSPEVRAYADRQALKGLTEDQAAVLRAYLVMDGNGDGVLTVDEGIAAVKALGALDMAATKAAGKVKAKKDI